MAKIRIKLDRAGIVKVLQSAEVEKDVSRRTEAIARAAGGAPDFEAHVSVVGDRVMGRVVTATYEGRMAEAKDRALTRALDAGR